MQKLSQSITKQESLNVIEHLLYENEISVDTYAELHRAIQSFDGNRKVHLEVIINDPVVVLIK